MNSNYSRPDVFEDVEEEIKIKEPQKCSLICWNDDVNTFEHVIQSLIEICDHTPEQAEQSTLIIHYNGKCSVRSGEFDKLRPMAEGLIDRGINATIE